MNFAEFFRTSGFPASCDDTVGVVGSSSGPTWAISEVGDGVGVGAGGEGSEGGGFVTLGLSVSDTRGGRINLAELFRTSGGETGLTIMTTAGVGWALTTCC